MKGTDANAQPRLSIQDYLALERAADTRHEYYRGEMFAMSGGSFRHAAINGNFAGELRQRLKGRPCQVLPADMRTLAGGLYTYPDIVILCGPPAFAHDQQDTLTNPTALIETLSPSTEAFDRGVKATHYRQLPSLQEYAFVSQTEPRVEVYRRMDDAWVLHEFAGLEALCRFDALACAIPMNEIYSGIDFEPDEPSAE